MQTFLPFPNFLMSAEILDDKRLNKQRVECKQIYLALTDPDYGWKHHPAVKMWSGYEDALVAYALECCATWRRRGGADHKGLEAWFQLLPEYEIVRTGDYSLPWWFGNEPFHTSHKSNLLRKDPKHYECFARVEGIQPTWSYVWPTKDLVELKDVRGEVLDRYNAGYVTSTGNSPGNKIDTWRSILPTNTATTPRRVHACTNTRRGAWKRVSVGRVEAERLKDYSYMVFTDKEQKP